MYNKEIMKKYQQEAKIQYQWVAYNTEKKEYKLLLHPRTSWLRVASLSHLESVTLDVTISFASQRSNQIKTA